MGRTAFAKGRHDNGALVDGGNGLAGLGTHDKVSATNADGHQWGVQAKALLGPFGRGAGNGSGDAFFKAKTHQGLGHLLRVVLVVFYDQAAGGAHADQRTINKTNVYMPAFGGLDPVARVYLAAAAHGLGRTTGRDQQRLSDVQGDIADRLHLRRSTSHHDQAGYECYKGDKNTRKRGGRLKFHSGQSKVGPSAERKLGSSTFIHDLATNPDEQM